MRRVIVGTMLLLTAFAARTAAQIPTTWKGEVELESEIPTVSLSGDVIMAKTSGPIPIDVDQGKVRGTASTPFTSDVDAPDCTVRGRGRFVTTIGGDLSLPEDPSGSSDTPPGPGGIPRSPVHANAD